ncbi:glycoside hydrolase family 2 [Paenibacillus rhizovicinus]|uniref:Glycoside hydrolase family 2 n=1 Tax=Paenibacillus rhizovicinus TaxID=2704463 RepID=A0A6C0P2Y4_9BACL|nr:sugar-binding domain-containing protein [Paenibacillus rhizovicinus]QHW32858.1 glycoside hydrolase family 2 [Paenibacillus rhizovicinus]
MTAQALQTTTAALPRPEYPRPDWQRHDWLNLNGTWAFQLQTENNESGSTQLADRFDSEITVPFSWASPLSGIGRSETGIGWYKREVSWSPETSGSLVFLRFGAVDYNCDVWINGVHVGSHSGGYGTFEFDVTSVWKSGEGNIIVVKAEDFDLKSQTRGKQGYGEIRGIWQPVWLEARPQSYIQAAKFITKLDGSIQVNATVAANKAGDAKLQFAFAEGAVSHAELVTLEQGVNNISVSFQVADPQLWSPESPYLYEGEITLASGEGTDNIATYFGIREISTALYGDRKYRWITLNGKPAYLNGTLDQAFHETGYFTYPTDEAMRDEIYLAKRIGLNFIRIHIKPEEPRKLYWADKLGMMVMEDMPCFWGNPDETARPAYEREAKEIIDRDFNHPSIFSWVMFNETWGLRTDAETIALTSQDGGKAEATYLPETQEWVRSMYRWAKSVDPTRIVEENSPCNWDKVESDINTWHFYINGYEEVRAHVTEVVENTYPGSSFNCIGGNVQTDAPLMNSECGNVWGFTNGAGDSDLAWHYRYMLNEFRRHDKMCGFVFTELRDVTNEFNGYYRLDGREKFFGYEAFVPGMSLADLHAPDFIVIDAPPCQTVQAGATVSIPLLASSFSDRYHGQQLQLSWELWHDNLGTRVTNERGVVALDWNGFGVTPIAAPLTFGLPKQDAVAVLALTLRAADGTVVTRNFIAFDVRSGGDAPVYDADGQFIAVPVTDFVEHSFAHQWNAIQEGKTNGGKAGQFVYEISLPDAAAQALVGHVELAFEASAKRLLARNLEGARDQDHTISMMHGADAAVEYNSNTYYMTDNEFHESLINVLVDGEKVASFLLPDNPADSRGVLSYQYQEVQNKLDEAGSYGYLCKVTLPSSITAKLDRSRGFKLTLEAGEGGLALYGRNAGRYPIDILVNVK